MKPSEASGGPDEVKVLKNKIRTLRTGVLEERKKNDELETKISKMDAEIKKLNSELENNKFDNRKGMISTGNPRALLHLRPPFS